MTDPVLRRQLGIEGIHQLQIFQGIGCKIMQALQGSEIKITPVPGNVERAMTTNE